MAYIFQKRSSIIEQQILERHKSWNTSNDSYDEIR